MLAFGRGAQTRAFRNNTGMGWTGSKMIRTKYAGQDAVVILNPRPLHAGLIKGSSDLVGWHSVRVTQEMVGRRIAAFIAIETKNNRNPTPEQVNFINQVNLAGGIAGVARDTETAIQMINSFQGAF